MDDTTKPDFAAADRDAPLMAASKSGAYYDDERNLARAYLASRAELATVQAERDAAMEDAYDSAQKMGALHIELATLRETLVGEVRAMRMEHTHPCNESHRRATDPHPPYDYERECVCNADVTNAALDRAITIIKGTP